jgi:hypothetical protein
VFHMDVANVDRDVSYVVKVVHIWLQVYVPNVSSVFRRILQVCLSRYCICFTLKGLRMPPRCGVNRRY